MKCYIHTDRDAVAMCTSCNSTICEECRVMIGGKNICKKCLEASSNINTNNSSNQNFNSSNNMNKDNTYNTNVNSSIDINMNTISKVLSWLAIIFSSINILNFGVHALNKIFRIILHLDFSLTSISWLSYDLLFFIAFIILLIVNLSKVTKFSFVNDDNIGTVTILPLTLIGLGIILVTLFTPYLGLFDILRDITSTFSLIVPIVCSLVSIFGIYKHKVNIKITY
ncbi:MAG: hypothetical protein ACRC2K_02190 [Clostridium sp.]